MFQNFFKIAVRNISRHKGFTFINVAGLAIGLAASLLILLWVQDEFSYEKYNQTSIVSKKTSFIPELVIMLRLHLFRVGQCGKKRYLK
jgi:hypothetical protein